MFTAQKNSRHGSIFLTQKRCKDQHVEENDFLLTVEGRATLDNDRPSSSERVKGVDTLDDLQSSATLPIIVRASNGKSKDHIKSKVKLSTIISPDDLGSFYTRYAETCKLGMQDLKKRDRSGRKKAKAKKRKEGDITKKE